MKFKTLSPTREPVVTSIPKGHHLGQFLVSRRCDDTFPRGWWNPGRMNPGKHRTWSQAQRENKDSRPEGFVTHRGRCELTEPAA